MNNISKINTLTETPEAQKKTSELPITEKDKRIICLLFSALANDPVIRLMKNPTLLTANFTLKSVHPLRSLEELFISPEMCRNMLKIRQSTAKWRGIPLIVKGFCPQTAERMETYDRRSPLAPYILDFAQNLGLKTEQQERLTALAKEKNWEQFIEALADFRSEALTT